MMMIMTRYQSAVLQVFQQRPPQSRHQMYRAPALWLSASRDYLGLMLAESLAATVKHPHRCEVSTQFSRELNTRGTTSTSRHWSQMTTTFCLINVSGHSRYSSVHCRWQSVSCCSRSYVEQSSIARHCCPLSPQRCELKGKGKDIGRT